MSQLPWEAGPPGEAPPWAADQVPLEGGEARPGRGGGGVGRAGLGFSPRPGGRYCTGWRAWVMAGGAAPRGAELLAFARFRDSSPQPLAYGYGPRSLRDMREREFGRLAGKASRGTCAGWAGRPWRARVFWHWRGRSFCFRWEQRHLIWDVFWIERPGGTRPRVPEVPPAAQGFLLP